MGKKGISKIQAMGGPQHPERVWTDEQLKEFEKDFYRPDAVEARSTIRYGNEWLKLHSNFDELVKLSLDSTTLASIEPERMSELGAVIAERIRERDAEFFQNLASYLVGNPQPRRSPRDLALRLFLDFIEAAGRIPSWDEFHKIMNERLAKETPRSHNRILMELGLRGLPEPCPKVRGKDLPDTTRNRAKYKSETREEIRNV